MTAIEAFITDLYTHYLGREPEPGAVEAWTGRLRQTQSPAELLVAFFGSAEFQGRHADLMAEVAALAGSPPVVAAPVYGAKWDALGLNTSFTIRRDTPPTLRLSVKNAGNVVWEPGKAKAVGLWDRAVAVPRPETVLPAVAPGDWQTVAVPIPPPSIPDIYGLIFAVEIEGVGVIMGAANQLACTVQVV